MCRVGKSAKRTNFIYYFSTRLEDLSTDYPYSYKPFARNRRYKNSFSLENPHRVVCAILRSIKIHRAIIMRRGSCDGNLLFMTLYVYIFIYTRAHISVSFYIYIYIYVYSVRAQYTYTLAYSTYKHYIYIRSLCTHYVHIRSAV